MDNVYVADVGMIKFGKYPDEGIKKLTGMVLDNLFATTSITKEQIEAAWFANAGWGMQIGATLYSRPSCHDASRYW